MLHLWAVCCGILTQMSRGISPDFQSALSRAWALSTHMSGRAVRHNQQMAAAAAFFFFLAGNIFIHHCLLYILLANFQPVFSYCLIFWCSLQPLSVSDSCPRMFKTETVVANAQKTLFHIPTFLSCRAGTTHRSNWLCKWVALFMFIPNDGGSDSRACWKLVVITKILSPI